MHKMNQPLPNVESLSFKIGISGTYWGKKPQYEILVNNDLQVSKEIAGQSNQIEYIEFQYNCAENSDFTLSINLVNKTDSDTVLDDNKTIQKDMLLNIESIEIEGIELETLKWTASCFVADDPNKPNLYHCVNLGWNGSYKISMTSPFYLWLLENS